MRGVSDIAAVSGLVAKLHNKAARHPKTTVQAEIIYYIYITLGAEGWGETKRSYLVPLNKDRKSTRLNSSHVD